MPTTRQIGRIPTSVEKDLKRGTNYLFGVGINAYAHFQHLNNAVKDVEDVADVLVKNYYFDRENMRLLLGNDASRENIIEELTALGEKLKGDDRLLIYYSGHGYRNGDLGFWIPIDGKPNKQSSFVGNSEVQAIVKSIKARHILLISDSCFSASLLARGETRDVGAAFGDFEKNPSRWVFVSGKGVVADGKRGTNSPFAAAILKQLRSDEEATNIAFLADQVTKNVRFEYEQQAECVPMYQSGHEGGQFVFLKRQTEKDRWNAVLAQNTEGSYLAFLKEYPDGAYAEDAEKQLEWLADEKEWQVAIFRNSAFAYRQYVKKYPNGNHKIEAQDTLDLIQQIERSEREEAAENVRLAEIEAQHIANQRLAKAENERLENERLQKTEAQRIENERLAKAENERLKQERLQKIEAQRIENERLEKERLDKIESQRLENKRLAKAENARLEKERLDKIEAQWLETDRFIKEENESLEQKIEAQRIENERLAKAENDRLEKERLAKIEKERKENERLTRLENEEKARQLIDNQQITEGSEKSLLQKYRLPVWGGGAVAAGLLIWQLTKTDPSVSPPISGTQTPVTAVNPSQANGGATPTQGTQTLDPKKLEKQGIGGGKQEPKTDPKTEANRLAEQKRQAQLIEDERLRQEKIKQKQREDDERKRLEKEEYDRIAAENAQKLRDRQAMQSRVNGYLNTALAAIGSKDKEDALSDLNNALRVAGLPTAAKIAINEAKAAVASADWNDAKAAIAKAAGALK